MAETETTLRSREEKHAGAQKTSRYASDAMAERRARILETARVMLVEEDSKITMRDLAKRSGVALATLYNIFESQDELIAQAVVQVFEERIEDLIPNGEGSILELIERQQELSNAEILRVPAYAKKMLTIYFSEDTKSRIRDILHGQAVAGNLRFLRDLERDGVLLPWVNTDVLASDMAVAAYAIITRWAAGEMSDEALLPRQKYLRLAMLAGAVTGSVEGQLKNRLLELKAEISELS